MIFKNRIRLNVVCLLVRSNGETSHRLVFFDFHQYSMCVTYIIYSKFSLMKTLILSSSLSPTSRSFVMCTQVAMLLRKKWVEVDLIDARNLDVSPVHLWRTKDMEMLLEKISTTDNIILWFGVHCYSISDNLKIILDWCFSWATWKFYGIICAAWWEKSYLSTMHLSQICMNERRMIQLPRILFASAKSFSDDNDIIDQDISDRIVKFSDEFIEIWRKLLAE